MPAGALLTGLLAAGNMQGVQGCSKGWNGEDRQMGLPLRPASPKPVAARPSLGPARLVLTPVTPTPACCSCLRWSQECAAR